MKTYLASMLWMLLWTCGVPTSLSAQTQQYTLSGTVYDESTGEPVPFAMVVIEHSNVGAITDLEGKFSFKSKFDAGNNTTLLVSFLGYQTASLQVQPQDTKDLVIKLNPEAVAVEAIVIKGSRRKYKRTGNPAVELAQRLGAKKMDDYPKQSEYFNYNRYQKMIIGLNQFGVDNKDKLLRKLFKFLPNYVDTCEITKSPVLPVSIKELYEDVYVHNNAAHTYVKGVRQLGIDEKLGLESNQELLNEFFGEIDFIKGDISLLQKRFVSPLSSLANTFYHFHILDTVQVNGIRCTDLFFAPANLQSLGFTGHLYVQADSSERIVKLSIEVPKDINLNFVKSLKLEQTFKLTPEGYNVVDKDDLLVELQLLPGKRSSVYGRRTDTYRDFNFSAPPDSISIRGAAATHTDSLALKMPDSFWSEHRHFPLTDKQEQIGPMIERLRSTPIFRVAENFTSIMIAGYIPTSKEKKNSKFDFGLINTFVSKNYVEGWRFRVGGMTTTALSKRVFGKGYVAYGLKDERVKYSGEFEYSFLDKKVSPKDFPIHSISASHTYDVYQPGLEYYTSNKDNFWLSLKRQPDSLMLYKRNTELKYQREFRNGLSYTLGARQYTQYPSAYLPFITNNTGLRIDKLPVFETELTLRYAPKERSYQTQGGRRRRLSREAPIFTLSHKAGIQGFLNSTQNVQRTEFSFQKRQWLSMFGHLGIIFKAGKVWNQAPFPLLILPNADLSYTLQEEAFTLMNPMEFINDRYLYLDLSYHMNGLILNRIPLIRALKLREIVTFKGLYGGLSNKNNPALSPGLFVFPQGSSAMKNIPYMEVGVGVDNIIGFVRLDYIWRVSYLDKPHINRGGLRISATVNF